MENPLETQESHKTLEQLKTEAKERLDAILYTQLTVENINNFADTALDQTVGLMSDLLDEYRNNPHLEGNPDLDTQQQEDEMCALFELPEISQILERMQEVKDKVDRLKEYLVHSKEQSDKVIMPADHLEEPAIPRADTGTLEEKKLIPRLLTLMYVLETDFNIDISDKEQVQMIEGKVTKDMMRQVPYSRVTIPDLQRVVYVCDEEGNATYLFDTEKLKELGISLDDLDIDGKRDKDALIAMHQGIGVKISQGPAWRARVASFLSEDIVLPDGGVETIREPLDRRSEFGKKEPVVSFDVFQREIKEAWGTSSDEERLGGIMGWYKKERSRHSQWPLNPYGTYKHDGWSSWNEVVGERKRRKESFLEFKEFQREVRECWDALPETDRPTDVPGWYEREYLKHPKWHSSPNAKYAGDGWQGYPELVGVANRMKKEYLPYSDFKIEVAQAWNEIPPQERIKNMDRWYQIERAKHPKWPSTPHKKYRDDGWGGRVEFIAKEESDS
jgi:hypothetical protein